MFPLAHAGDWIEGVILGGPALVFGAWLAVTQLRERRAARRPSASE